MDSFQSRSGTSEGLQQPLVCPKSEQPTAERSRESRQQENQKVAQGKQGCNFTHEESQRVTQDKQGSNFTHEEIQQVTEGGQGGNPLHKESRGVPQDEQVSDSARGKGQVVAQNKQGNDPTRDKLSGQDVNDEEPQVENVAQAGQESDQIPKSTSGKNPQLRKMLEGQTSQDYQQKTVEEEGGEQKYDPGASTPPMEQIVREVFEETQQLIEGPGDMTHQEKQQISPADREAHQVRDMTRHDERQISLAEQEAHQAGDMTRQDKLQIPLAEQEAHQTVIQPEDVPDQQPVFNKTNSEKLNQAEPEILQQNQITVEKAQTEAKLLPHAESLTAQQLAQSPSLKGQQQQKEETEMRQETSRAGSQRQLESKDEHGDRQHGRKGKSLKHEKKKSLRLSQEENNQKKLATEAEETKIFSSKRLTESLFDSKTAAALQSLCALQVLQEI